MIYGKEGKERPEGAVHRISAGLNGVLKPIAKGLERVSRLDEAVKELVRKKGVERFRAGGEKKEENE